MADTSVTQDRKAGPRQMDREQWLARGRELYGDDPRTWKFRCVRCGNVQSHESVKARNPEIGDTSSWIFFACEGRRTQGVGCDWSLGGLFRLHRLEVRDTRPEAKEEWVPCFEFADDPSSEPL